MTLAIVIPCFNEADRLSRSELDVLCSESEVSLILVNDGSTDDTLSVLREVSATNAGQIMCLDLGDNRGKGEAVRHGLLHAIDAGFSDVAYLDADFATPAAEMLRLKSVFDARPDCHVLLASRWLHLGADIRRSALRHYSGRVFATLASLLLRMPVYDTQCGAKLFRVTSKLGEALSRRFVSRWAFDVELIGRLSTGDAAYPQEYFDEVPLNRWVDIRGSKVGLLDAIRVVFDLAGMWRRGF